jgi:hypothetical protein
MALLHDNAPFHIKLLGKLFLAQKERKTTTGAGTSLCLSDFESL